jgi:hypothetical protein
MRRRCVRALLVLVLMASLMPTGLASSNLEVVSYVAFGPIVRVTVSNSAPSAQSAMLVVVVELSNGLTDISLQPVTVSGLASTNKSSIFSTHVSRIIYVGISEGPDPVSNIARF